MDSAEGARLIGKICRYWERKIPSIEIKKGDTTSELDTWFDEIKWIPDGYGEEIYQRFTRMDSRPINIPLRIQEVFRGLQGVPKNKVNFLISTIMRHADQNDMNHLEAFYDLRWTIKKKELDIQPTLVWLRSEGHIVDLEEFNKPSLINFGHLKEWLNNPGRQKMKPEEKPVQFGEVILRDPGEEG